MSRFVRREDCPDVLSLYGDHVKVVWPDGRKEDFPEYARRLCLKYKRYRWTCLKGMPEVAESDGIALNMFCEDAELIENVDVGDSDFLRCYKNMILAMRLEISSFHIEVWHPGIRGRAEDILRVSVIEYRLNEIMTRLFVAPDFSAVAMNRYDEARRLVQGNFEYLLELADQKYRDIGAFRNRVDTVIAKMNLLVASMCFIAERKRVLREFYPQRDVDGWYLEYPRWNCFEESGGWLGVTEDEALSEEMTHCQLREDETTWRYLARLEDVGLYVCLWLLDDLSGFMIG